MFTMSFLSINDVSNAYGLKSKGNPTLKFGTDTKSIVCGDNLCSKIDESDANNLNLYFDGIRHDEEKLFKFFKKMPKGGDLHNHLSGSISAENLIELAIEKNLCFNDQGHLVKSLTDELECPTYYRPASGTIQNDLDKEILLKQWSYYKFDPSKASSHDHFFDAFGKFAEATKDKIKLLDYWKRTAENQNIRYAEVMLNAPEIDTKDLAEKISITSKEDLTNAYSILKNYLDQHELIPKSIEIITKYDKESKKLCDAHMQSCDVIFRYILQTNRNHDLDRVFAAMVTNFDLAEKSDLVVGINMVNAEDGEKSLLNYNIHMEMIYFLKSEHYPDVNIALHAGELWPTLPNISEEDVEFHIYDAIYTGHATRIGHGVDIQKEITRFPDIVKYMHDNKIAVEVPLTSNYLILGISPDEHPVILYHENSVPIVLSSDDAGILRTNITNEYHIAAVNYPQMDYLDFKNIVRNTLEYSFLPGKSLWVDSNSYDVQLSECDQMYRTENCWYEESDKKAAMQFELEEAFYIFESDLFSQ